MALSKTTQSMPFVSGPDMETDPKLTAKPAQLLNAVFRDQTISKRNGRISLPTTIAGGGSQTVGEALIPFNTELVRINGGTAYGFADGADQWVAKPGGNNYATLSTQPLVVQASGTGAFDHCIVGNVGVIAWVQTGIHIAVYDVQSGTFFQSGATAVASSVSGSIMPRLVALGTKVLALWADVPSTNLYSAVVDTTAPTVAPTQSTIRTDVYNVALSFDAVAYSSALAVVAYPTNGTDMTLIGVNASGAVTATPAPTTVAGVAAANGLRAGILVQRDTAGSIYVVFGDQNARRTRYIVRDAAFALVLFTTDIVTTGNWNSGTADFYAGASLEMTANAITLVLANATGALNNVTFLGTCVVGSAGITTAFGTLPATAGLFITGDLVAYDGTAVLGVVSTSFGLNSTIPASGTESSAYVINLAGQVVGKALPYQSRTTLFNGAASSPRVCRSFASGVSAKLLFWQQGKANFQIVGGVYIESVTALNIVQVVVTKSSAGALPMVRVGGTEYIGGAYPRIYDGVLIGEAGFQLSPTLGALVDHGAGGTLSAGTYQYCFLFSWVNANGELTRGVVSAPASITLAASHSVDITIDTMPLAMRDLLLAGAGARIEVYRTLVNQTVFYRQSSLTSGAQNSTTAAAGVSFNDNIPDTSLQVGELLYTTGGVLDWEAPPAYSAAFVSKQRLVLCGLEDPYAFLPSSEWTPGETVRFNAINTNRVPSSTGPTVGGASLDGKLVVFTTGGAYVTIGDGPDLRGANNYPPVERIASVDAGPTSAPSIVETPLGIMFQGPRGITLLDRSLNVNYIGSDVSAYATGPWVVRSAVLDIENQEVRFQSDPGRDLPGAQAGTLVPSSGGVSLVYNYYYNQWSIFPAYGAQDACLYQGDYTTVVSNGACRVETDGTFRDDGAYYSTLVETPWMKLAGLQGFQRIYYATLLGTYGSDFTLTWEVAYNYATTNPEVPVYSEVVTLDGAGLFALGGQYQVRHHLGHKCVSVKFRLSDSVLRGTGEGMALTDLTLEVGIKRGAFRLPAAQTA